MHTKTTPEYTITSITMVITLYTLCTHEKYQAIITTQFKLKCTQFYIILYNYIYTCIKYVILSMFTE